MIEEKLTSKAAVNDFGETGLEETPMFEKYEKESVEGTQDEIRYLSTDFYLNTSIVLPRVDRLSWGKVVR